LSFSALRKAGERENSKVLLKLADAADYLKAKAKAEPRHISDIYSAKSKLKNFGLFLISILEMQNTREDFADFIRIESAKLTETEHYSVIQAGFSNNNPIDVLLICCISQTVVIEVKENKGSRDFNLIIPNHFLNNAKTID